MNMVEPINLQATEMQDAELQAYIDSLRESLGIEQQDLNEQNSMVAHTSKQNHANTSVNSSGYQPWSVVQSEFTFATPESVAFSPNQAVASSWFDTLEIFSPLPLIGYSLASAGTVHTSNGLFDPQTPEFSDVPEESSPLDILQEYESLTTPTPSSLDHYEARPRSSSEKQNCHSGPVAPSQRSPLSSSKRKAVYRPYPSPSSRPSVHNNISVASSSTQPVSGRNEQAIFPGFPKPIPKDRIEQTPSQNTMSSPPLSIQNVFPSGKLIRTEDIGLRVWKPNRAHKVPPEDLGTIDFETVDSATGKITPGTLLADRYHDKAGRSLRNEDSFPFPGKKEKGFNLRILWPGYEHNFSKKISIHKPLAECTVRDARDWIFNAMSDFILLHGKKVSEQLDRRVGASSKSGVVDVQDLMLMQLKQAGKGTWVPVLHLCFWEKRQEEEGETEIAI